MGLYNELAKTGCKMDSHESDLYVEGTAQASAILRQSKEWPTVKVFVSAIDGRDWYDVPFAYAPWWERRLG